MTLEDPIYAGETKRIRASRAAEIMPGVRYMQMPDGMAQYYQEGFTLSGPAVRVTPNIVGEPITRKFDIHGNLVSESQRSSLTTFTYDDLGRVTKKVMEATVQYYEETTSKRVKTTIIYNYPGTFPADDNLYVATQVNQTNGHETYRHISTPESRRQAGEYEKKYPRRGL